MKEILHNVRQKLVNLTPFALLKKDASSEKDVKREGAVSSSALSPVKKTTVVEKTQPALSQKNKKHSHPDKKKTWSPNDFKVVPQEGMSRFYDFELPVAVLHGIADEKFKYCTPIQEKALPTVLAGNDLVGRANTGTGKSAVFLIGIFSRLLAASAAKSGSPRALILAPTRELVVQIAKDGERLGRHTGLSVLAVYGGAGYEQQMDCLQQEQADVVVATPGRLLDFLNKRVLSLQDIAMLVIDEADRMLDMGFIPDMRRIIARVPSREKRQTLLFSATVSEDVKRLASQWCVKPCYVEMDEEQVTVDAIEQKTYLVTAEEKYTILYNLLKKHPDERVMIFANMKTEVRKLSERLSRDGIACLLLSGDVAQMQREKRLERFRRGQVKVLVATDVAGRGIHIEGISFVVNYTLPFEPEDYVHRIGRTGRAGATGISVSFACEEGSFYLPAIEEYIERSLPCCSPEEDLLVPVPPPPVKKQTSSRKRRHRRSSRRSFGQKKTQTSSQKGS